MFWWDTDKVDSIAIMVCSHYGLSFERYILSSEREPVRDDCVTTFTSYLFWKWGSFLCKFSTVSNLTVNWKRLAHTKSYPSFQTVSVDNSVEDQSTLIIREYSKRAWPYIPMHFIHVRRRKQDFTISLNRHGWKGISAKYVLLPNLIEHTTTSVLVFPKYEVNWRHLLIAQVFSFK